MARTTRTLKAAPFKSDFLLLDVKTGRAKLAKQIAAGETVRVLLEVTIYDRWGQDDGTSIEFCGQVESLKVVDAS